MSEAVLERAAKAVYESYGWATPWDQVNGEAAKTAFGIARAAIMSIREPDEDTVAATLSNSEYGYGADLWVWTNTIDAILQEVPE